MPNIEVVWQRIRAHEGEVFHQVRGGEFRYRVVGNQLVPDRTRQQIPRSHFERALELAPLPSTTAVQRLRGPSYLFAVLMDDRIRRGDW